MNIPKVKDFVVGGVSIPSVSSGINNPGKWGELVSIIYPGITVDENILASARFEYEETNPQGSRIYYRDIINTQKLDPDENEDTAPYGGWTPGYECERLVFPTLEGWKAAYPNDIVFEVGETIRIKENPEITSIGEYYYIGDVGVITKIKGGFLEVDFNHTGNKEVIDDGVWAVSFKSVEKIS